MSYYLDLDQAQSQAQPQVRANMMMATCPCWMQQRSVQIIHVIFSMLSLYLFFRCNQEINVLPLLAAVLCPFCYIPYALAVPCRQLGLF